MLHLAGGGLLIGYAARYPALAGLGAAAYLLGLRHACRPYRRGRRQRPLAAAEGRNPLGIGFWFSLGQSLRLTTLRGCEKNAGVIAGMVAGVRPSGAGGPGLWAQAPFAVAPAQAPQVSRRSWPRGAGVDREAPSSKPTGDAPALTLGPS